MELMIKFRMFEMRDVVSSSSENSGGKEVWGATQVPADPAGAFLQGAGGGEHQQESETCPDERINRAEMMKNTLSIHSVTFLYIENV